MSGSLMPARLLSTLFPYTTLFRSASCLVRDCDPPRSRFLSPTLTSSSTTPAALRASRACRQPYPQAVTRPDENVYSSQSTRRRHRDGSSKADSRPTPKLMVFRVTSRGRHRSPGLPSSTALLECYERR